jgi:hypothetical protein
MYKFTWRHVSEDWNLHQDQCENLKSHKPVNSFIFMDRILVLDYHFHKTVIILSLVQVILTITAVSPFPTWYRTPKLSLAYCWDWLWCCSGDDIQDVLFNTGLPTIVQMTLFLYSNQWCHPFCSAHSHVLKTPSIIIQWQMWACIWATWQ